MRNANEQAQVNAARAAAARCKGAERVCGACLEPFTASDLRRHTNHVDRSRFCGGCLDWMAESRAYMGIGR